MTKFHTATLFQFDADVVGCVRDPITDNVTTIDTYNVMAFTRNNVPDPTQDVIPFSSSFINGIISCTYVHKQVFLLKCT